MEITKVKNGKRPKLESKDEYEVERIVKHYKVKPNKYHYFIKWKGWAACHNTWEPLEHLNCDLKLETYLQELNKTRKCNRERMNEIKSSLIKMDPCRMDALLEDCKENGKIVLPSVNSSLIEALLWFLSSQEPSQWDNSLKLKLENLLEMELLVDLRTTQLQCLQDWEKKINETAPEKVPLKIENNVDLEGPPLNFTFVQKSVSASGICMPADPPIGCECKDICMASSKKCCSENFNCSFAYFKGLLKIDKGMPIYECNSRCKCSAKCGNRVIQHGRSKKMSIFRTSNNCGWGLKALERIKKGSFITQYVGELITNEEADKRGIQYDAAGHTYLFDLDFNGEENAYTIDATSFGNESHFINHSCDPNSAIFAAFIECLDPNLPLLAIFAIRDIKSGEEITFDYLSQNNNLNKSICNENSLEDNIFSNYLCKCGASNCRTYLFL